MPEPEQPWNVDERFYEAEYGKRVRIFPRLATRGDHCRSGDTLETRVRAPRPDTPDESGAQQVTGRFTSNQADAQGRRA
jgi:hypothetical protein